MGITQGVISEYNQSRLQSVNILILTMFVNTLVFVMYILCTINGGHPGNLGVLHYCHMLLRTLSFEFISSRTVGEPHR